MLINNVILIFVWLITAVILFIGLNPILIGSIFPTMRDIANDTDFMDMERYDDVNTMNTNLFYMIFAIFLLIPFLYLLIKALYSREPSPYQRGGYYNAFGI